MKLCPTCSRVYADNALRFCRHDGAYLYERNYRLEVVVRSVENRKCGGFAVMTAPVDIVRLSKTDRTVIFRETEVVPECH